MVSLPPDQGMIAEHNPDTDGFTIANRTHEDNEKLINLDSAIEIRIQWPSSGNREWTL